MTQIDPIVAEVRAAREAFAERFGGDLEAMAADLRRRQPVAQTVDRSNAKNGGERVANGGEMARSEGNAARATAL